MIRVKRQRTTMFIQVSLSDSIGKVKNQISNILFKEKLPKDIRLHVQQKGGYNVLEDNAILEQVGVVDDGILYMTFNSNYF
jgi:hypothetical protein